MADMDLSKLVPMNLDAVEVVSKSTTEAAASMAAKTSKIMDDIEKTIKERENERELELASLPLDARKTAKNIDQRVHNSLRNELKKEAIKTHEPAIRKMMESLHDRVAKLETASELVGDGPEVLLTTRGMTGSERSGVLFQQVNSAHHAMLAGMARRAVAASDIEMAAQISMRLAGMPIKERPISPQDLGKALLGPQHAALRKAIDTGLADAKDGLANAGQFLVGRKETPMEKMARGVRARKNENPAPDNRDRP